MITDQRWPPKVPFMQTWIWSFSKFSYESLIILQNMEVNLWNELSTRIYEA